MGIRKAVWLKYPWNRGVGNFSYLKNFAPSCVELSKAVTDRKDELHVLEVNVISLKEYKKKIQRWFGEDIEDAVFEEIN